MNCQSTSWNGAAEPMPVSPCDEAYENLRAAQERSAVALMSLVERLDIVLKPDGLDASTGGPTPVPPPATSEMHGRFIAATERAEALTDRLQAITRRLTI